MTTPPADVLRLTRRFLPRTLVGGSAQTALTQIARVLPDVGHAVGFECRLRAGEGRVDLGITVERDGGGRGALARRRMRARGATPGRAWATVGEFCRRWATSPIHDVVPRIFLEFDADASAAQRCDPSIFAVLNWGSGQPPVAEQVVVIAAIVDCWLLTPGRRVTTARVRECVAALPPRGELIVVGAMLARPGIPLRLSLVVPRPRLRAYLERIGCSREVVASTAELADATGRRTAVDLDLEVRGDGELSAVAVQLIAERRYAAATGWPVVLHRLVRRGWCTDAKRRGLLAWPGVDVRPLSRRGWPLRFERYLSSVKLVRRAGEVDAKAYFAVVPQLVLFEPPARS